MKKLLIILLLPISFYSQNDYRDTVIEAAINKKINEYRVENGLHELTTTERFRTEIDSYAVIASKKVEQSLLLEHSGHPRLEIMCFTPCSEYWSDTKEDAYKTIFSADSISELTMEAWKNSPGHNSGMLDESWAKQIITSAYVFYIDARQGWATVIVTQLPTETEDGSVVINLGN